MEEKYDLAIIGAGPGGYTAAIKASQAGLKTVLIESREIGGTCLNRGCIPTKTIMHSSHLYQEALSFEKFGIELKDVQLNMDKIYDRKEEVVGKIRDGIGGLLKANKITVINGTATIAAPGILHIMPNSGEAEKSPESYELSADKILLAAGSLPYLPEIEGITLPNVVTSDELLNKPEKLYKKLLIIGGGVIGVEFATIYQEFGCEVEILEAADRILPLLEREVSQSVAMNLKKRGIKIHAKSKVVKIWEEEGLSCNYEEGGTLKTVTAEGILVSTGRKANTDGLFKAGFSLEMDRDKIKVNTDFETSVKGIYAIGDLIKGTQLAHAAAAQGIAAVEKMCGLTQSINLEIIPSCIYTSPEVAVAGLSEEEAVQKGYTVKTGKYPMSGNAKTLLSMDERSYVKVISDASTHKLLGAQIICARATDMIGEFASAIVNGLTVRDMASVIRPHPTYNEAITEAVEDIEGMAIHLMPARK
ncbi:dihydrolipoyl dehydrogenase [Anaerocolumna sp. AGMB13025]|uniref:dihydrolipoyl dehydrogenase n=1 Tax=Anaerocolumna sp. AGMB13025 TaxID=3039116 RepID=UPI00241CC618|nr:dihydrolipoyl dehydrogenase [Anaerocolumna sp. AGMB13025]WFR55275.1 dihydrolipoyl dehydrogenase [Anaerocolumna sp. AGMB13025]